MEELFGRQLSSPLVSPKAFPAVNVLEDDDNLYVESEIPGMELGQFELFVDIVENENELTLYGDLPGVCQNDLDIRYENEQLIIHGRVAARNEGIEILRQEYAVGDFHRVFSIGESIKAEAINAEVRSGVLVVHLPKAEAAKPKRIAVKAV